MPARNEANRLEVHHVSHRAGALRDVALDRVGERVHAGEGRETLGHRRHHLGIDERNDRNVVRVDADELALLLDVGDDVVDRNFSRSAGGRRNGENREARLLGRGDALERADIRELRVGDDYADGLGGVHGAAAANRDDAVGLRLLRGLDAVLDVLDRRVRLDVGVERELDLRLGEDVGYLLRDTELHEVGVGEHYWVLEPARGKLGDD